MKLPHRRQFLHLAAGAAALPAMRRTGAVISNQARFRREQVTFAGKATAWMRTAESGNVLTFHFCPTCGSTVYWEGEGFPGYVAVAIGSFADPNFPAPTTVCGRSHATPGSPYRLTRRPSTSRSRGETTSRQPAPAAALAFPRSARAARLGWTSKLCIICPTCLPPYPLQTILR